MFKSPTSSNLVFSLRMENRLNQIPTKCLNDEIIFFKLGGVLLRADRNVLSFESPQVVAKQAQAFIELSF